MSSDAARYFPDVFGKTAAVRQEQEGSSANILNAEVSDEVLLAQVGVGDKEALANLFHRFARVVRTVAFRILQDSAEADDLLQDLFLFIYRKCDIFDSSKGSARSWIVQMTYHRAIDRRRYLQSRHFYSQVEIDDDVTGIPDPRTESAPYDRSLEAVLGREDAQHLFELLSDDQRETFRLLFFDGYSFEEIAARLGQSLGNIRNHYYRGLEKIRQNVFPNKLRGR